MLRLHRWLETRAVAPAYGGWLLGGLSLFFFAAATNTLAGWLYVISGIMLAILAIAIVLPARSLRHIQLHRLAIEPVSVAEKFAIELVLANPTPVSKLLLQVRDGLPPQLAASPRTAIEAIPPQGNYRWRYELPAARRGIYRWETVELRTAAPLGLFWARRSLSAPAKLVVYPTVLPLAQCPLLDLTGRDTAKQLQGSINAQAAHEGVTRTLRPYRWGDPTRLVHWRSSARYGELRVRELEVFTSTQAIAIALDLTASWRPEDFEQAVIAAASLYFYAVRQQRPVTLWTGAMGSISGQSAVLEALAAVTLTTATSARLPDLPLLWLSADRASLDRLPPGSCWLLWGALGESKAASEPMAIDTRFPGQTIDSIEPLQLQLQRG